jgi:hypothetical protein
MAAIRKGLVVFNALAGESKVGVDDETWSSQSTCKARHSYLAESSLMVRRASGDLEGSETGTGEGAVTLGCERVSAARSVRLSVAPHAARVVASVTASASAYRTRRGVR